MNRQGLTVHKAIGYTADMTGFVRQARRWKRDPKHALYALQRHIQAVHNGGDVHDDCPACTDLMKAVRR